ncbi:MAG TPA: ABC transporter substrate-binding protein [Anaerolineales bacterium]|nr:ABC transporter substrate-binding protein [Anaerolineales bacterium]
MFAFDNFHQGRKGTRFSPFYPAILFLISGVFLLAASGSAAAGSAGADQPQPVGSQSLTIGILADPQLDPAQGEGADTWIITAQIYETLVAYQPGGTLPEPRLAESWTVSADGLTWFFKIRPGVKFHDGTDLDTAAVAYNLQRWWDPAHPFHDGDFLVFTYIFGGFKGDPNCLISGVSAASGNRVKITLKEPHMGLPSMLAMPAFAIASPDAIQSGTLAAEPVGSGPFAFAGWIPGNQIDLQANPDYWGTKTRLAGLTFQVIPLDQERFTALQSGAVQVVGDLPGEFALDAAADPDLALSWRPANGTGYLGINRAHLPLDNLLVRQAISHAIDRSALIATQYGTGFQIAKTLLPPEMWGNDPNLVDYEYDPERARSLLAQAGYPAGFETTLSFRNVVRPYLPDPPGTAQAIASYLGVVGIQAVITEYESGEFLDKFYNGELDLFLLGWTLDYLHPDHFFTPNLCDSYLGFGPKDEALCDILASARAEPDFAAQEAFYRWATQRVHATLPLQPLAHQRSLLLARRSVQGLIPSPLAVEEFNPVYLGNLVFLPLIVE